jgi:hypothetical protein
MNEFELLRLVDNEFTVNYVLFRGGLAKESLAAAAGAV